MKTLITILTLTLLALAGTTAAQDGVTKGRVWTPDGRILICTTICTHGACTTYCN
jgi:hypothetical protein